MAARTDARERMIHSATQLFRERGIHGTSFADVLAHSGAPRGSVYHHFAGGKTQLAEEAMTFAGDFIIATVIHTLAENDPPEAMRAFGEQWTQLLHDSDFTAGCPIAAGALAGDREPTVSTLAGSIFLRWQDTIAEALTAYDVPQSRARSLASLIICAVEGAVLLAQSQHTTEALDAVTIELSNLIAAVMG